MSRDPRKLRVFHLADDLIVDVTCRLEFLPKKIRDDLDIRYTELLKGLQKLIQSLESQS